MTDDYSVRRCMHEGFTLVRLPAHVDPRGPQEQKALARAHADNAWRKREERPAPIIPRNVIRFGSAAK